MSTSWRARTKRHPSGPGRFMLGQGCTEVAKQATGRGMSSHRPFYDQDGITICCGDCREVLRGLPAESAGCVVTDPPYLVNFKGRWDQKHKPIAGDGDGSWLLPVFREVYRVLKPNSFCVSFYGWPHADLFLSGWKE